MPRRLTVLIGTVADRPRRRPTLSFSASSSCTSNYSQAICLELQLISAENRLHATSLFSTPWGPDVMNSLRKKRKCPVAWLASTSTRHQTYPLAGSVLCQRLKLTKGLKGISCQ